MAKDELDSGLRPSHPMPTPDERLFSGPFGDDDADADVAPKQFGRFLIKRIIGRGGMGVVYLADQTEPFHREVALKFIRRGSSGSSVIHRFNLERQALAVMNHEHIARVYDADATEDGQPYFVMEYVPGERVDEFCDHHHLSVRARLKLFLDICAAIQHAHQKGIIHRDLKPSNILVCKDGSRFVAKVIDFGVVKTLDPSLSDESLHTEQGRLMGTPQYMSPEQLSMGQDDVDTRADVYALGVLLFELLTSTLPYENKWENVYQYIVNIRKAEPPRASQRLGDLDQEQLRQAAKNRDAEPDQLGRILSGDIDWILLKALARDRDERYGTVSGLAEDISRYLNDQPVSVGRPSVGYVVRKFVRRHQIAVVAAGSVLLCLVAGIIATSYAMLQARSAEREAQIQRERAITSLTMAEESERRMVAVNGFMTRMLSSADPGELGREVKVIDVLQSAAQEAGTTFADDPSVETAVRRAIGKTYMGLGQYEKAEVQISMALEKAQKELGESHPETLLAIEQIGLVHFQRGRYTDAERVFRDLKARISDIQPVDEVRVIDLINDIGLTLKFQGRYEEASALYRQALAERSKMFGDFDERTIESMNNLAMALKQPTEREEAENLMRLVFERISTLKGDYHPWTMSSLNNLAYLLSERGDWRESIVFHRESLARRLSVLGEDHPHTLQSRQALAQCLRVVGSMDEAEHEANTAYQSFLTVLRANHPTTLKACLLLVGIQVDLGKTASAMSLLDEKQSYVIEEFGQDSLVATTADLHRIAASCQQKDFETAKRLMTAIESRVAQLPPWMPNVLTGYRSLIMANEQPERGIEALKQVCLAMEVDHFGAEPHFRRFALTVGQWLREQKGETESEAWLNYYASLWPQARTSAEAIQGI